MFFEFLLLNNPTFVITASNERKFVVYNLVFENHNLWTISELLPVKLQCGYP